MNNFKIDYNNYKYITEAFISYAYLGYTMAQVRDDFNDINYNDLIEIKRFFQIKKGYLEDLFNFVYDSFGEEGREFIEKKLDEIHNKRNDRFSRYLMNKQNRLINEAIELKNKVDRGEVIFEKLIDRLIKGNKKGIIKNNGLRLNKKDYRNETTYVFSDVHFGKSGNEEIVKRMNYLLETILEDKAEFINLVFSGDLVETLAIDGMHPGQLGEMDIIGVKLANFTIDYMTSFLEKILSKKKKVKTFWCPGNHDRMTKEHYMFDTSWGKISLFYVIKAYFHYNKNITVDILEDVWNKREINGFNFIIHHGDDKTNKKDWRDVMNMHGETNKHNIQISGHMHYTYTEQCGFNFTRHQVGMIAGDSTYGKNLLLKGECSFSKIKRNEFKKPEISTIFLGI